MYNIEYSKEKIIQFRIIITNIVKIMNEKILVYIGTYTRGKSEGIYVYEMDPSSGALEYSSKATGLVNPSFLDLNLEKNFLYSVNEVKDYNGKATGAVSSFSIDSKTGELTFINTKPSEGTGPCHLSVDNAGRYVLVANYLGGNVSVIPIQKDGSLADATDFIQHKGSSIDPRRQESPHAHNIILDSANRYTFVSDLGIDKIMIYKYDSAKGKLTANDTPWIKIKVGAGPRHLTFHPEGNYAYLINELNSTITAFTYDSAKGMLKETQTVPTLPEDFTERNHCADIHVTPSGKFVYGSNRGHDSIVIYEIDTSTGRLTYVDHEPTKGKTPRNFAIDNTGTFLLAANQDTDSIVTFRINKKTGRLTSTGHIAKVPMPVCLKLVTKRLES